MAQGNSDSLRWRRWAFTAAGLLFVPVAGPALAQEAQAPSLVLSIGGATGTPTEGHVVFRGGGALPLTRRLALMGDGFYLTSTPTACEGDWPASYRCSFRGGLLLLGPKATLMSTERADLRVVGTAGLFRHTDGILKTTEPATAVGGELEVRFGGRWSIEVAYRWLEIFDSGVEELLLRRPRLHVLMLGLALKR